MSFLLDLENRIQFNNDKYGCVIIGVSILTRIFVVSIAWSYGAFILALKKSFPDSYFSELGWIAGLAQGLGSVISPVYIIFSNRFGIRVTFTAGLILCFLSLLASSFATSEHYLFFTYSLPFGIGSSILFVLGSLLTGTYFPPSSRYHIPATVAISLGFPLGFLLLNPLTNILLSYYNWQIVQRIYSVIIFLFILISYPLFTEKYADEKPEDLEKVTPGEEIFKYDIYFLKPNHVSYLVRFLWMTALLFNSCANNSIQINLNGYFNSMGPNETKSEGKFLVLGTADTFYRVILSTLGSYLVDNLSLAYIAASFVGMMLSILCVYQSGAAFTTFFCIFYAICPAVLMSLMYSVNSEISGAGNIKNGYTMNVMISGFGIILGPILSGYLLDKTSTNYRSVFILAAAYYAFSLLLYSIMKFLLVKNARNNKNDDMTRTAYEPFENEN